MSLPIDELKPDFIHAINTHGRCVITSPTGSGKSTRLPLWLREFGKVLVVEPRRVACIGLTDYLSQTEPNIGMAIRYNTQVADTDNLVFVTPGVALRWFSQGKCASFDVIMIDEFHERRWDTDVLLALLLKAKQHKLVVTSATLAAEKVANYLDAPLLEAKGKRFDVDVHYLAAKQHMPSTDNLEQRICDAIDIAHSQSPNGDMLVFLPGKSEINTCYQRLKHDSRFTTLTLHGQSSADAQNAVLTPTKEAEQRVILATNVAETSLTLADVKVVIDSGLERRTRLRNGISALEYGAIAKDAKTQRLGRTGRTGPGYAYCLYGEFAPLDERTLPDLLREPVDEAFVAAKVCDDDLTHLPLLDAPKAFQLAQSQHRLVPIMNKVNAQRLKALYELPLAIEDAILLEQVSAPELKGALCDLFAVTSTAGQVFDLPRTEDTLDALKSLLPDFDDISVTIAAIRGELDDVIVKQEHYLEAKANQNQLRGFFALGDEVLPYQKTALIGAVANACASRIFVRRHNRRGSFANGSADVQLSKHTFCPEDAEGLLVFHTFALAGKGKKNNTVFATHALPLRLIEVSRYAPLSYEREHAWFEGDAIMQRMRASFAGVTVANHEEEAKGEDVIGAMVLAMKAAHHPIYAALHAHFNALEIYFQFKPEEATALLDVSDYLHNTLADLGVSSVADLALFDESDFMPNYVPEWELTPVSERFPAKWQLNDMLLEFEYSFKGKRVIAHHLDGKRKDPPKRWELPAFSGFKVQYKKASKVVDVR